MIYVKITVSMSLTILFQQVENIVLMLIGKFFSFSVAYKTKVCVTVSVFHLSKSVINSLLSWGFLFLTVKSFCNDIAYSL